MEAWLKNCLNKALRQKYYERSKEEPRKNSISSEYKRSKEYLEEFKRKKLKEIGEGIKTTECNFVMIWAGFHLRMTITNMLFATNAKKNLGIGINTKIM